MAMRIFLEIEGVDGESKLLEGAVDLMSYSFSMSRPSTAHLGSGGSGGDLTVSDFVFTHNLDAASNGIRQYMVDGKQDFACKLTVVKPTKDKVETLKYDMKNCMFTSVVVSGGPADDVVMEDVSLAYSSVDFAYTPEEEDGSAGSEMACTIDIEAGGLA
ncbi:MAG TPA: type VI secretion system tube protein Hcp [Gammaproteobacteria bacterium]|nr:type VI secretion system tube protein Hcp [Gammaproteobacteria bacterium]